MEREKGANEQERDLFLHHPTNQQLATSAVHVLEHLRLKLRNGHLRQHQPVLPGCNRINPAALLLRVAHRYDHPHRSHAPVRW